MDNQFGIVNNYAGVVVSLNQKKVPYFGVGMMDHGKFKVWLSKRAWCIKLPEGLSDKEAQQINEAIAKGILVEGRQYLPSVEKDPLVLARYVNFVKESYTLDSKAKAPFQDLIRKKQDGNYTAVEIIAECLRVEEAGRRRPTWVAFLNDAIKAYDGPQILVEDYRDDPEAYRVTIDASGVIVDDSRKDKKPQSKKLTTSNAPTKARESALNKFLGDEV